MHVLLAVDTNLNLRNISIGFPDCFGGITEPRLIIIQGNCAVQGLLSFIAGSVTSFYISSYIKAVVCYTINVA